jgi:hypothetical protein
MSSVSKELHGLVLADHHLFMSGVFVKVHSVLGGRHRSEYQVSSSYLFHLSGRFFVVYRDLDGVIQDEVNYE